jgi:hypothetical protein
MKLRVFDFVTPEPPLRARILRWSLSTGSFIWAFSRATTRAVYQWLMHPVLDTREPSEPT